MKSFEDKHSSASRAFEDKRSSADSVDEDKAPAFRAAEHSSASRAFEDKRSSASRAFEDKRSSADSVDEDKAPAFRAAEHSPAVADEFKDKSEREEIVRHDTDGTPALPESKTFGPEQQQGESTHVVSVGAVMKHSEVDTNPQVRVVETVTREPQVTIGIEERAEEQAHMMFDDERTHRLSSETSPLVSSKENDDRNGGSDGYDPPNEMGQALGEQVQVREPEALEQSARDRNVIEITSIGRVALDSSLAEIRSEVRTLTTSDSIRRENTFEQNREPPRASELRSEVRLLEHRRRLEAVAGSQGRQDAIKREMDNFHRYQTFFNPQSNPQDDTDDCCAFSGEFDDESSESDDDGPAPLIAGEELEINYLERVLEKAKGNPQTEELREELRTLRRMILRQAPRDRMREEL